MILLLKITQIYCLAQISLSLEQLLQIKDPYIEAKLSLFKRMNILTSCTKLLHLKRHTQTLILLILYNARSKTEIAIRKLLLRAR